MATDPDPGQPTGPVSLTGVVLEGTVHDLSPLMILSPDIDGGQYARPAFGTLPDAAQTGDPVRLLQDPLGNVVLLAWQAAP